MTGTGAHQLSGAEAPYSGPAGEDRRSLRLALIVLPCVAALLAAATSDVGLWASLRFAVWTIGWWVVGLPLAARLPQARRSRFAEASFAGVLGIIAQLCAWALFVALGVGHWLSLTLVLALGTALCWPRGRRAIWEFFRPAPTRDRTESAHEVLDEAVPTSALLSWSLGSSALAVMAAAFFHSQTLPPKTSSMYQDLFWHLGIAADLKRQVIPHVVESHTGQLNYHWLSDAYMAAGSLGAHISTMYVAERLWVLPILLLSPALLITVARQVAGSWSGSWLAVLITTLGLSLPVLPWQALGPAVTYLLLSPSQVFGVPMTLFAVSLMVGSFRSGRLSAREWIIFCVVGFVCAGSKSSIIPVFLGGTSAVLLTHLRARTPERRARRRSALALLAAELVALVAAMPLFAGGSAGSKIRLLGHLRHWDVVSRITHHPHAYNHGPFLPPGLSFKAFVVLTALVVAIILSYGLGGFALLLGRRIWGNDAVPTLLVGSFLASVAAFLLIDHTGQSEAYFPMGAMPLLALLAAWGWAHVWADHPRQRSRQTVTGLILGFFFGALIFEMLPHSLPSSRHGATPHLVLWLGLPLLLAVVCLLAIATQARSGHALIFSMAVAVGVSTYAPARHFVQSTFTGLTKTPQTTRSSVTPAESSAAAWIRKHTPEDALVATNVHCLFMTRVPYCTSSAYWTSALAERAFFVGSWGYTDGAQRNAGVGGRPAINQAFPDHSAFTLNEAMFYAPSLHVAQELRRRGVSYLYADSRVAPLSPDLPRYAHPVHTIGTVTIYRLG